MDEPKVPTMKGIAYLDCSPFPQPGERLSPTERTFAKLRATHPVFDTPEGLAVGLFHKTAYSTVTGEPISYIDCRHQTPRGQKINDRFIFAIRNGQLTLVEHLSRRVAS
ncbi:hypothetical protein ABIB06_006528 [Bradyrhizobium sp. LB8.2]|uniref:hypothetical protein n=1 Tax=unclassified Bradyrhizobium TaxID=2631580 RepID=UPI00339274EC